MGINRIEEPGSTGDVITSSDVQQFASALKGDVVPRNPNGNPAALAGSSGTEIYPWSAVHAARVFVDGREVNPSPTGGPGAITPGISARNAVVSGAEPAGRPGMSGWLRQAGSSGVVVQASTTDPLIVKLDNVQYTRTATISGGTLPSAYTQVISLPTTTGQFAIGGGVQANTRARYQRTTGGIFPLDNVNVAEIIPASYGDVIIVKSTGGGRDPTYMVAQRASEDRDGARNLAKLATCEGMNTSPTAQVYPRNNQPWNTTHTVIRAGHVFTDPLTANWNLTISKRIIGSVDATLPATTGYDAGDVIFREADQRWYRFSGSAWVQTSFVYLGLAAINSGGVEAVMPVRTEASLASLLEQKLAILGDPVSREGVAEGSIIYYGGDQSGDLEQKGMAELGAQSFRKVGSDALVDTSSNDAGTLSNDTLFCTYYEPDGASYHFEEVAPMWRVFGGRLLLLHPNRARIYVGSFATDSTGALVAQATIGNPSSRRRTELDERNDDTWVTNPHLFGRSRCTDLAAQRGNRGYDRSVEIDIRGFGTSNTRSSNLYRRTGIDFWNYNMVRKEQWDAIFYGYLTPYCIEQIMWDVQHDTPMKFVLDQWDEESLLYATGLSPAAREGQVQSAGATGAIASIDAPQLAEGSVGADALAFGSVVPDSFDATNNPTAGTYPKVVLNGGRLGFTFDTPGSDIEIPDNSIELVKLAADDFATEAEVLSPNPTEPKLVTNVALNDKIEEIEASLGVFWTAWTTAATTAVATIPASGTLSITDFGNITYQNTSGFNARTATLAAGELVLAGTNCTDLPSLTSGTLRGALIWNAGDGTRWAAPIDNPEGPDGEEFFRVVGGNWTATGFDAAQLLTSVAALPDDNSFYPITTRAHDKPGGNFFMANCGIARRHGGNVDYIYPDYSTSQNRFELVTSMRDFEVPVRADSVTPGDLKATNEPAAGQVFQAGATADAAGTWVNSGGGSASRAAVLDPSIDDGAGAVTNTTAHAFLAPLQRGSREQWAEGDEVFTNGPAFSSDRTVTVGRITFLARGGAGSTFNPNTSTLTTADAYLLNNHQVGSNLPAAVFGGTNFFAVLAQDAAGTRWIISASTNSGLANVVAKYSSGAWTAVDDDADELEVDLANVPANNRWYIVSRRALGLPLANNVGGAALAKRNGAYVDVVQVSRVGSNTRIYTRGDQFSGGFDYSTVRRELIYNSWVRSSTGTTNVALAGGRTWNEFDRLIFLYSDSTVTETRSIEVDAKLFDGQLGYANSFGTTLDTTRVVLPGDGGQQVNATLRRTGGNTLTMTNGFSGSDYGLAAIVGVKFPGTI